MEFSDQQINNKQDSLHDKMHQPNQIFFQISPSRRKRFFELHLQSIIGVAILGEIIIMDVKAVSRNHFPGRIFIFLNGKIRNLVWIISGGFGKTLEVLDFDMSKRQISEQLDAWSAWCGLMWWLAQFIEKYY